METRNIALINIVAGYAAKLKAIPRYTRGALKGYVKPGFNAEFTRLHTIYGRAYNLLLARGMNERALQQIGNYR